MRIFLSYVSEQSKEAALLKPKLENEGHRVFFDRTNLPPGYAFDQKIREELRHSDLLLFLISPESVQKGAYTLTELKFYQDFFPKSHGRVLPVQVKETAKDDIPAYLRAVTILKPAGDMPAEVTARVSEIAAARKRRALFLALLCLAALAAIGLSVGLCRTQIPRPYHALLLVPWTGIYDRLPAVSDPETRGAPVFSLRIHFGQKIYPVPDLRRRTVCLAPHEQLARAIKDVQAAQWIGDVVALSPEQLTPRDQKILVALAREKPVPLEVEGMQGNEVVQIEVVSTQDGKETVEPLAPFTMDGQADLQAHLLVRSGGAQ
jgi:hypothetical protein